jgi:hypothetical protein
MASTEKINFTLLVLLVAFALHGLGRGQQPSELTPVKLADFVNRPPAGCESRTAALDGITQKTPPDELIFVIARLGKGENRPRLAWRRLQNVRAYWTQFLIPEGRRKTETIILAEGTRVEGAGRLEFYVSGKLVWVLNAPHNADIDFGDCIAPDDRYIRKGVYDPCWLQSHRIFFPCRDR